MGKMWPLRLGAGSTRRGDVEAALIAPDDDDDDDDDEGDAPPLLTGLPMVCVALAAGLRGDPITGLRPAAAETAAVDGCASTSREEPGRCQCRTH